MRAPDGSLPLPANHSARETVRRLAEVPEQVLVNKKVANYYRQTLRITLKDLCRLIIRATEGDWKLWTGTTVSAYGHVGEPFYYFCPPVEGQHVFIKFKVTQNGVLHVFSMHEDDLRGKLR